MNQLIPISISVTINNPMIWILGKYLDYHCFGIIGDACRTIIINDKYNLAKRFGIIAGDMVNRIICFQHALNIAYPNALSSDIIWQWISVFYDGSVGETVATHLHFYDTTILSNNSGKCRLNSFNNGIIISRI